MREQGLERLRFRLELKFNSTGTLQGLKIVKERESGCKVIILAGGLGTRLAEYTESIPKPMVPVGGKPILWHIMQRYAAYGFRDFFVALGYKAEVVKRYFLQYGTLNSDFSVDLATGRVESLQRDGVDWKVTLIDTGADSMTGGRAKRISRFAGRQTCMLTYGDGLGDVDLGELLKFHRAHGKMATVTAVHPVARFGEIRMETSKVLSFKEKPQIDKGWINGGFFVFEPEFFDLIRDDSSVLEKEPLEEAARMGELIAYRHEGFWQCMDTKRDRDSLEKLWQSGDPPWIK